MNKPKYITLTPNNARSYREKRKKMTRRVVKLPKWIRQEDSHSIDRIVEIINSNDFRGVAKRGVCDGVEHKYTCPYGKPGDQIILGTTWAVSARYDHLKPTELPEFEGDGIHNAEPIDIWSYFEGDEKPVGFGKLRPARFLPGFLRDRMPTETLKIVRAERVQCITDEDAMLEGIFETPREPGFDCWSTHGMGGYYPTPRRAFLELWDSINANRGYGWAVDPWVWALGW